MKGLHNPMSNSIDFHSTGTITLNWQFIIVNLIFCSRRYHFYQTKENSTNFQLTLNLKRKLEKV